jgi:hypothetical protein
MMPEREHAPLFKLIEGNSLKDLQYNMRRETMRHGIGLQTKMTVKVADLIEKVKANRKKHEETYRKAVGVYMSKIAEAIDDRKEEYEQFDEKKATYEELAAIGGGFGFTPPRSYLDSYDDILAVLEMATEEVLELDSQQLANIIRDKWDWEREFNASTVMYANEAE